MSQAFSYKSSGVDIGAADTTKRALKKKIRFTDKRVLNTLGAFAALFDARFPGYTHPVLVLKTEEPGSKQKIALEHGRIASICEDMVNHLINDIAVMGATPLSVQDCVVCGKLEKRVILKIVESIAKAAQAQGATLTGGETSEQPGVIDSGTFILTSSVVGVVERSKIIDGRKIRAGDRVLAVASNGLHTNGYSLVRALMKKHPEILRKHIGRKSFLDAMLVPHKCYIQALKGLFGLPGLHGLAHITGGGIEGNLNRILPKHLDALIDLSTIRILPIFKVIQAMGQVSDRDMLQTFNMGVGLTVVCHRNAVSAIQKHLKEKGCRSYSIGEIIRGRKNVICTGKLR